MKLAGRLKRRHAIMAVVVLIVVGALVFALWPESEQEVYVALFGREGKSAFEAINRHALRRYLDLLSDEIPGYRFVLKPFYLDDASGRPPDDPATLRWLYETVVVPDERYVMVIDNTWAKHVQAVGSLVRADKIPMLSLNADMGHTDFGGYGIFIGHADLDPIDLVTYMNEVIQPATVALVGESDYWLTKEFLDLTQDARQEPGHPTLHLDHKALVATSQTTDIEKSLLQEKLRAWFKEAPQPAVLLLNVHNNWGHEIIDYVDLHLENVTILAPNFVAREGRSASFPQGDGGNRLILMTGPEDAVSKRVAQDVAQFRERYPDDFLERFNSPFFVKRCLDSTEIMREALLQALSNGHGELRTVDRKLFASYFRSQLVGKSVPSRYDLYSFDAAGRQIPERSFVEYDRGVATSQWFQLNSRRKIIPTVFFGIDLLDVGRLDPVTNRFRADFYYWVRAQQDKPSELAAVVASNDGLTVEESAAAGPPEITPRPVSDFIHFRNLSQENSRTLIDSEGKGTYRLERISGEFDVDFQLKDYPLDTQELTLDLELANPFDDVRVAFDYAAFEQGRRGIEIFDIPGWKLVDYYVTVDNVISQGLRGALPGETQEPRKYKTLTVRIVTQRKIQSALITVALPLCIIGMAALSLLFIRATRFSQVGDVYVGVFLSIITYSIAFAQVTPATGVMTRADYLFYLTFLAVLLVFLRFVALNALGRAPEDDATASSPRQRVLGFSAVAIYVVAVLVIAFR